MLIFEEAIKILHYKDLIRKLSFNQIKVKYRYPILGFLWLILLPTLLALILLFAFSVIIKVKIPHYPFFIYIFSAMLPWTYFSTAIFQATNALIESENLVKNVAFCREILPLASILTNLINFVFTLPVFFLFIFIFRVRVPIYIVFFPFVLFLHTLLIAGVSFLTSSFQVRLRDTKYIVEIVITALFYLTPVFYPLDLVKEISPTSLKLYMLNPLVAITILYRITLLGGYTKYLPSEVNLYNLIILPIIFSVLMLYLGLKIFKKTEPFIADLI